MGKWRSGRPWRMSVTAVGVVALSIGLVRCGGSDADDSRQLTVMTRNLYLGVDLTPVLHASAAELGPALTTAYTELERSDVPGRLASVAREIGAAKPDVVALQEAVIWRVQSTGQTDLAVRYDFVEVLLGALKSSGLHYSVASAADGFDQAMPVPGVGVVSIQDRDVILVRASNNGLKVSNSASGVYRDALSQTVAGVPITLTRSWASIDLEKAGGKVRLFATHLEPYSKPVRDAQASALLTTIRETATPTLLLGDLNSPSQGAGNEAYELALKAGFVDSWAKTHPNQTGFTCCRNADLKGGELDERIDFVLSRGGFKARGASIVGVKASEKTSSGLWPSDHAGVVARIDLPETKG